MDFHSRLVDNAASVQPGVYKLYTNGHTCAGRFHDRIPCWMGPCFWSWYASRVLYPIYSGASKLVSFAASDPPNKCIGFAADSAAREYIGFIVDDAECVSISANGPNQCVDFQDNTSSAKFGGVDTANVSYGGPCVNVASQ